MLTSKQRAYLRGLSVDLDTILMIGKGGMSDEIINQAQGAIDKREIIKGKVLVESCPISPREAADIIAEKTGSEIVHVIGSKFVLYKKNPKEPKIVLPKAPRKQ